MTLCDPAWVDDDLRSQDLAELATSYPLLQLANIRDAGNERAWLTLNRIGAAEVRGSRSLDGRRNDLIVFYGWLCRRADAVQAALATGQPIIIHEALSAENCVDEDTIDGNWDLIRNRADMTSHMLDIASRCFGHDPY